jgi:hypothetical protein
VKYYNVYFSGVMRVKASDSLAEDDVTTEVEAFLDPIRITKDISVIKTRCTATTMKALK